MTELLRDSRSAFARKRYSKGDKRSCKKIRNTKSAVILFGTLKSIPRFYRTSYLPENGYDIHTVGELCGHNESELNFRQCKIAKKRNISYAGDCRGRPACGIID